MDAEYASGDIGRSRCRAVASQGKLNGTEPAMPLRGKDVAARCNGCCTGLKGGAWHDCGADGVVVPGT